MVNFRTEHPFCVLSNSVSLCHDPGIIYFLYPLHHLARNLVVVRRKRNKKKKILR